mmetsp:Transcript_51326/g.133346  ORF Transcript_51326/g.133346 Transcript_51326/m.133346 type:complete len:521 (-) Transcript_51326:501-2063(-)
MPESEATPTKAPPSSLGLLALVLVLGGGAGYLYATCGSANEASSSLSGGSSGSSSWASNGISESSSGTLFRAVRVRTYDGPRSFSTWRPSAKPVSPPLSHGSSQCKNWAVTTTIFPPTTTVLQIASLADWCLVIAGDKKTPRVYNVSGDRAHYLSPDDQDRLPFATNKHLNWNHFGRKNVGFLYAIQHGARWVYDTDDDNELQSMMDGIPLPRAAAPVEEVSTSHPLYNLYPQMSTNPSAWPRGFPLEAIKDNRTFTATFSRSMWSARRLGVIQSLADHDPDVDGIYRLTQPLPFNFRNVAAGHPVLGRRMSEGHEAVHKAAYEGHRALTQARKMKGSRHSKIGGKMGSKAGNKAGSYHRQLVSLRSGTFMPYNAQATLHSYEALWGLLLPVTVHGRVTDIWRSYFTQRLLWDVGLRIAFSTPWVTQYRNAHNYLADFNSELPLYQQAGALVKVLKEWKPAAPSLPGRLEELYILMYELNLLGLKDLKLMQAWLADLVKVGYRFPQLVAPSSTGAGTEAA